MGAADRIADLILRQGEIAGRGAQNTGAIWGGALQNLGQQITALPTYVQNQRMREQETAMRDQEMQMRGMALQQQQRGVADQQSLDDAMRAGVVQDANGNYVADRQKVSAYLLQRAPHLLPTIQKHWADADETDIKRREAQGKLNDAEVEDVARLASTGLTGLEHGLSAEDSAALILPDINAHGANGIIDPESHKRLVAQLDAAKSDPQAMKTLLEGWRNKSKAQSEAYSARALADKREQPTQPKPFTNEIELRQDAATQGTSAETPTAWQSVETLRQLDADKAKPAAAARGITNEVELAQDAATLGTPNETPTARQSKTALDRLRPVKPEKPEPGTGPLPGANIPDVAPGQKNEAFFKTLPPPVAAKVKALVEGRIALPARIQKGDTYWQGLLDAAVKYDPSFDAVNYNARSKTRADFTSGKSAQQVNALNTAIGHMDRLLQVTDALGNFHEGSLGPLTTTANEVKNWFSQKFGSKEIPAFNVVRKAVSDELTRVWRQAGGSEQDIQENLKNLASSNTPEQLYGAVGEFGHLLESKLDNLKEQYRQGMGTDPINMVTPEARRVLDKVEGKSGGKSSGVSVTAPNGQTYNFPTASDAAAFKARAGIK